MLIYSFVMSATSIPLLMSIKNSKFYIFVLTVYSTSISCNFRPLGHCTIFFHYAIPPFIHYGILSLIYYAIQALIPHVIRSDPII